MSEMVAFVLVIVTCGAFAAVNVAGIVLMKRLAESQAADDRAIAAETEEGREESAPPAGRAV